MDKTTRTKTYKKARLLAMLLLCAGLFSACFFAITKPVITETQAQTVSPSQTPVPQTTLLSGLSEKESIEFILRNGVEIPKDFIQSPKLGSIVKRMIQAAENDPN